ncbi:sugar transferase [Verrucomicrobiota bacterium]
MYRQSGKRILDLIVTICAMIGALPLMFILWFLVRISLGRPLLFCQLRPGLNGNPFLLFKFRTMREACDDQVHTLPDAQRLTKFGNFLRSTSLDELPELFNVLKGDMSLVGPRPLLMQYLPRYNPQQARRHEVKPGLTGWAQVNGRNAISWDKKFALDVWYVDNLSLWLDLKIIILTFLQIFQRKDINQPGHATMPEFMGNSQQEG